MQSCNPAILQSCNPAILQSCNPAILQDRDGDRLDIHSAMGARLNFSIFPVLKFMGLEMDGEKFPFAGGLQTSAEIMISTCSVAEYLLSPVRKAWHEAGREW
jgi:hypothetical protein